MLPNSLVNQVSWATWLTHYSCPQTMSLLSVWRFKGDDTVNGSFFESVVELAEATVVMTRGRGEGRCRYLCFGREHHHHPPNPRAKQANPRHYKDVGLPSHSMLLQSCTPNLVLVQLYILVFLFVLVLPHSRTLHLFSSLGWEKHDVVFHQ